MTRATNLLTKVNVATICHFSAAGRTRQDDHPVLFYHY